MNGLSGPLVQELRRIASQGASVPDLLRLLHERLGDEAAYGTLLAKYFMVAFDLPLRSVSPIGGWAPDSTGEISDARIQELIHPEIMRTKPLWHGTGKGEEEIVAIRAGPHAITALRLTTSSPSEPDVESSPAEQAPEEES